MMRPAKSLWNSTQAERIEVFVFDPRRTNFIYMAEDYQVQRGDCINSIAFDGGFFWETLWHHASNASLKSKRKDPNVLMEGDFVHIPDIIFKEELVATEESHRFKRK